MKKTIFIVVVSSLTAGCASFQPSTYSNQSTQNGNVVTATGSAASAAASANRSYNCPSCVANASGQRVTTGGYTGVYTAPQKTHLDSIADSVSNTLANAISGSINASIYNAFE